MFNEHCEKMTLEFERKSEEYEVTRNQIVANHEFLKQFYLDMQRRLNEKHDKILLERDQWEKDKSAISGMVKLDSEVVALNVGGTHHMMTERDVLRLCPGSILERMFNGLHELKKIDNEVFLDRDGKTF